MKLDAKKIPEHVAIIMDGNGRWAKKRGLPRVAGHKVGADRLEDIIRACSDRGIKVLTVFAFSTENWQRPKEEVSFLLQLIYDRLEQAIKNLGDNGVKVNIIGGRDNLEPKLQQSIAKVEADTKDNSGFILNVAFNYSGKWDILNATRKLAQKVERGELPSSAIDYAMIEDELSLANLPKVDLVIRTSGELRISNFLLWQIAYSELYFTDTYWPAFDANSLDAALAAYAQRKRRFGKVN